MRNNAIARLSLSLLVVLASAGVSRSAAADPSPEAQQQLGWALQYCEKRNPYEYAKSRDAALKLDASLRQFGGKIRGKWVANEMLAKCEREMPALGALQEKLAAIKKKEAELKSACWSASASDESTMQRVKALRASLVAEMSGYTGKYEQPDRFGDYSSVSHPNVAIAECDRDIEAKTRKWKEQEAKNAAEQAANAARKARADAEKAAEEKRNQAAIAALKGDRASLYKTRGAPSYQRGTTFVQALRAPRWEYVNEVTVGGTYSDDGESDTEHRLICVHRFDFTGDKVAKPAKVGPGCKYE
jgi:hypothetical protein